MGNWTFLSNHGHVLVCLSRNNQARLRDVAADVGITERAVQKIVRDLQDEGYISISKHGRRNRYRINSRKGLRHALESQVKIGKLLGMLQKSKSARKESGQAADVDHSRDEQHSAQNGGAKDPEVAAPPTGEGEPAEERAPDTRQQGSLF